LLFPFQLDSEAKYGSRISLQYRALTDLVPCFNRIV